MNSLKFIEDEIKVLTKRIKELKEEEDLHWNYEHEDEAIECDFQREEYEDLLKEFQQIKAELEVMELIKNGWSSTETTLIGEQIMRFQNLTLDDWFKLCNKLEEILLKKSLEKG